ncbi:hypothetical protein [uncultured Brachyspira sp.]|uniref:hypothetical protein n=1 Tax=uncultured Brachyspira sp. TaxID=221953 RepID=UPI002614F204|nr:hypothetical protein [uncultured Brachyspira sp.]
MIKKYGIIIINNKFYLFQVNSDNIKPKKLKGEEYFDINSADDCRQICSTILDNLSIDNFSNVSLKIIYDNINFNNNYLSKLLDHLKEVLSVSALSLSDLFYSKTASNSSDSYFEIMNEYYRFYKDDHTYEAAKYKDKNSIHLSLESLFLEKNNNKSEAVNYNNHYNTVKKDIEDYLYEVSILLKLNLYKNDLIILQRVLIVKALCNGMSLDIKDKKLIREYINNNMSESHEKKILDKYEDKFNSIENSNISEKKEIITFIKSNIMIKEIRNAQYLNKTISLLKDDNVKNKVNSYFK